MWRGGALRRLSSGATRGLRARKIQQGEVERRWSVLGTVVVAVQIENHRGAARLRGGDTKAKGLELSFLLRVTFIVIPALLSLIGTTVPSTGQKVFGAVDQVLSLFK